MMQRLYIENFKSIAKQEFSLAPLTILAGTNSSGKSSIIQAILMYSYHSCNNLHLEDYLNSLGDSKSLLNLKTNSNEFTIKPTIDNNTLPTLIFDRISDTWKNIANSNFPVFERELFYLSSNRIGQEDIAKSKQTLRSGIGGEYLFGFFEIKKNESLTEEILVANKNSSTLSSQVNYWFQYILGLNIEPQTRKINNTNVVIAYKNNDLEGVEVSPFNLGAGISYLVKILILGLSLQPGNLLIIENPEVHLHPKAISKLADFFVFLTNAGIQVILETHSEHIINKIRYAVFGEQIHKDDVNIYYRDDTNQDFQLIKIDEMGQYIDKNSEIIKFPQGFFDSDLNELLEMV